MYFSVNDMELRLDETFLIFLLKQITLIEIEKFERKTLNLEPFLYFPGNPMA